MKDKILAALKTKYKHLGFGDKEFETVAALLEDRVKEESEIETAIAGVENLLKAFQGGLDKVRTEKSTTEKKLSELEAEIKKLSGKGEGGKEPGADDKDKGKTGDDTGKSNSNDSSVFLQAINELKAEIKGLKTEKLSETRKSRLATALKDARETTRLAYEDRDVTAFESEEAFESWITKISTAIKTESEELAKQGLVTTLPASGGKVQPEKKVKEATPEEIQALSKAMGIKRADPKL